MSIIVVVIIIIINIIINVAVVVITYRMSTRFERVRLVMRQRRRLRRGGHLCPIIVSDEEENGRTLPIEDTQCPICRDTLNQCKTAGRELMSGVWHICPVCRQLVTLESIHAIYI